MADEVLARHVLSLIDLTDLADDHSAAGIDRLCERAARYGTAAVCVWPEHVARASRLLRGTPVRVATVVNFPGGDEPVDRVVAATIGALADGADEIDVVLPYRAYLAGDVARARAVLEGVRAAVGSPHVLKVILETGELDDRVVADATRLAVECGADFVKTSTGKVAVGASSRAARTMLETVASMQLDRTVGLKPSGGIRTVDDAAGYLAVAEDVMGEGWATPRTFRFGASGLLDDVLAVVGEADDGVSGDTGADRSGY